jgi:hypothetical protein
LLVAASLLASECALAQSTTATGAAIEVPNAVIMSIEGVHESSVMIEEPVVVGEPLPAAVEVLPVPGYIDYRYALVNNHRLIVEPGTRRVIRVIE